MDAGFDFSFQGSVARLARRARPDGRLRPLPAVAPPGARRLPSRALPLLARRRGGALAARRRSRRLPPGGAAAAHRPSAFRRSTTARRSAAPAATGRTTAATCPGATRDVRPGAGLPRDEALRDDYRRLIALRRTPPRAPDRWPSRRSRRRATCWSSRARRGERRRVVVAVNRGAAPARARVARPPAWAGAGGARTTWAADRRGRRPARKVGSRSRWRRASARILAAVGAGGPGEVGWPDVVLTHVAKSYGDVSVIAELDLEVRDEEFMVLVGPSGCGKSTALRMIAGLEEITGGDDPHRRPRGQRPGAQGPRHRHGVPELRALSAHDGAREPRVRPARCARSPQPEIERAGRRGGADPRHRATSSTASPSSSPAASASASRSAAPSCASRRSSCSTSRSRTSTPSCASRCAPRSRSSSSGCKTTTVYVTHDQVEAMTMGHRIAVMKDGKLQQVGTPLEVYERPHNLFVANFIGTPPMNLVTRHGRRAAAPAWSPRTFALPVPEALRAAARRPRRPQGDGRHPAGEPARGRQAGARRDRDGAARSRDRRAARPRGRRPRRAPARTCSSPSSTPRSCPGWGTRSTSRSSSTRCTCSTPKPSCGSPRQEEIPDDAPPGPS